MRDAQSCPILATPRTLPAFPLQSNFQKLGLRWLLTFPRAELWSWIPSSHKSWQEAKVLSWPQETSASPQGGKTRDFIAFPGEIVGRAHLQRLDKHTAFTFQAGFLQMEQFTPNYIFRTGHLGADPILGSGVTVLKSKLPPSL